jgi:hypothetical protein
MHFLKGTVVTVGTIVALLIATYVFLELKVRPFGQGVGVDIRAVWTWMVSSPVYWTTVLALLGSSVWVFRRWVISH